MRRLIRSVDKYLATQFWPHNVRTHSRKVLEELSSPNWRQLPLEKYLPK